MTMHNEIGLDVLDEAVEKATAGLIAAWERSERSVTLLAYLEVAADYMHYAAPDVVANYDHNHTPRRTKRKT